MLKRNQFNFAQTPSVNIQRSKFNRNHSYKTAFDAGKLIPFYVDEVLPGDTFNVKLNYFARLATPLAPIMDNIYMDTFFFFVPYRLVWNNFQKFMGEQTDPGDSTDYTVPQLTTPGAGVAVGDLLDYMGCPLVSTILSRSVNALPTRAYNLIWNEWFRDQNLQDSVVVDKDDGPDTYTDYVIKRRGKRHDYFTSALPWAQKGDAVSIPLGTSAPINLVPYTTNNNAMQIRINTTDALANSQALNANSGGSLCNTGSTQTYVVDPNDRLEADLSTATAATINQLREAFSIQQLLERDARGGTRYTEVILSHFGVRSSDARLQRPEYLGGGSAAVNINPVAQTSSTDATTPQGNLAAFGTVASRGDGFVKSFEEHGVLIGLIAARADITYQQGLDRMWSRSTKYDFYWPALANIGEQAILSKELWYSGLAGDDNVFGYIPRYDEYRYKNSKVTGIMRSDVAGSLDYWHLAQDFATVPTLNSTFIEDNPPIDRVIATPSEPHFIFDSVIECNTVRPMPLYGVPGMTRL